MFSPAQVEQLLRPLNPRRVQRNDKGMSHLAAYDVSAHLTRIFGFGGWRKEILALELVAEDGIVDTKRNRIGWHVTYRCSMRLHVGDWWNDDGATGSASNLPDRGDAHDFAMKNAISYALKRCAKDLGDQFGLGLYNKGSLAALVIRTLAQARTERIDNGQPDVDADVGDLAPDWDEQPPGRDDGLPVNRDGSLSRSRTTDEEKDAAGNMTSEQWAEHTALQKGAIGKLPKDEAARQRHEQGTPADDPFYVDGQDTEALRRKGVAAMFAQFSALGIRHAAEQRVILAEILGREVPSRGLLNVTELTTVNVMLRRRAEQAATP